MKNMQNHCTVTRNQGFPKIQKARSGVDFGLNFFGAFWCNFSTLGVKSVKKTSKQKTRKTSRKKVHQGLQAEGLGSLKGD